MKTLLRAFLRNEDGATAIEYSLVAACIAAAVVGAWSVLDPAYMTSVKNIGDLIVTKASK